MAVAASRRNHDVARYLVAAGAPRALLPRVSRTISPESRWKLKTGKVQFHVSASFMALH